MSKSIIKRITLLTMSFSFVAFVFANNGLTQLESEEAERQLKIDQGLLQPIYEADGLEQNQSININIENIVAITNIVFIICRFPSIPVSSIITITITITIAIAIACIGTCTGTQIRYFIIHHFYKFLITKG